MLVPLLLTTALAALPAPIVRDLDGDGAPEQLAQRDVTCLTEGEEHGPPCLEDDIAFRQVALVDDCGTRDLLRDPHETFVDAQVVEADGDRAQPEVLVLGFSGAAGRNGEARLLRIRPGCARPRTLIAIPSTTWRTRRPKGASYASTGDLVLRDVEKARPGSEVILDQPWYKRRDPGCCPTWIARAVFRYDTRTDRYVKLRERLRRVPRP